MEAEVIRVSSRVRLFRQGWWLFKVALRQQLHAARVRRSTSAGKGPRRTKCWDWSSARADFTRRKERLQLQLGNQHHVSVHRASSHLGTGSITCNYFTLKPVAPLRLSLVSIICWPLVASDQTKPNILATLFLAFERRHIGRTISVSIGRNENHTPASCQL